MEIGGSKITLFQRPPSTRSLEEVSYPAPLSSSFSPVTTPTSAPTTPSSYPLQSPTSLVSSSSSSSSISTSSTRKAEKSDSEDDQSKAVPPNQPETTEAAEEAKPTTVVAFLLGKLQNAFHLRDMEKTKELCDKLVSMCLDDKNQVKNCSAFMSNGGFSLLCEIVNSQSDPVRFEIVRPVCLLLSTLSQKAKYCRAIAKAGGTRPALHLMKLLIPHPPSLPRNASRAVVQPSPRRASPVANNSNSESTPVQENAQQTEPQPTSASVNLGGKREVELLTFVLTTLVNLSALDSTKLPLVVRLEGGLGPLLNLLKVGLEDANAYQAEYSFMLSLALQFLASVVDKNGNNSTAVMKEGGVITILGYLQKLDGHLALVEPAVLVLSRVAEKEKTLFQDTSGVEVVVSIAKRYVTNLAVVLPVLGLIFNILGALEDVVNVADMKKDDIFALCEISEKNPHDLKVANMVCSILGKIIKLKQTAQQPQATAQEVDIPEDGPNVVLPTPTPRTPSPLTLTPPTGSPPPARSTSPIPPTTLPPLPSNREAPGPNFFPEFLPHSTSAPTLPQSVFTVRTAAKKLVVEAPVHIPTFPPPSASPAPSPTPSPTLLRTPSHTFVTPEDGTPPVTPPTPPHTSHTVPHPYVPPGAEAFQESRSSMAIEMMMRALRVKPEFKPVEVYNSSESVSFTPRNSRTLQFESRFESGNLNKAYQIGEYEYNLTTSPDTNTQKHTQWFYFRVSNIIPRIDYKFNVVNMEKPTSEFNRGMRPLMYSEKEAAQCGAGWLRCGRDICYHPNQYARRSDPARTYHTLTFTVQFTHAGDTCYFAVNYPYTVSMWKRHLAYLVDGRYLDRLLYSPLCKTIAGNTCDLLTITSLPYDPNASKRKYVVFSARVHPGESGCSYMMKGIIDFLVSDAPAAKNLRNHFVFKIIPMLNMDGVAEGNHRTSLSGVDLNRQWLSPSPLLHAPIFYTKELIRNIHALHAHEAFLYVDLHCHFRKKNIFIYGCEGEREKGGSTEKGEEDKEESGNNAILSPGALSSANVKSFPYVLSQKAPCFSFADCSFKVQESKKGTGRVVVWRELHINFSFTMEASFSGMSIGPYKDQHLNISHLENMGKHLCQTLTDFTQCESGMGAIFGDLPKADGPKVTILPSVGPRRKGLKPKPNRSPSASSNVGGGAKAKPKAKPKKV